MKPTSIIASILLLGMVVRAFNRKRRFKTMLTPEPDGKPAYVVFDVETTGLAPDRIPERPSHLEAWDYPYIVSIAWLVVSEDDQLIRSEHHLVRPPVEIPMEATRIHGITNEQVRSEGKELKPILERLANDFAAAGKCAAHNLMFDKTVVAAARIRTGLPDPFKGIVELDIMRLGADWVGRRSFKLHDGVAKVLPNGIRRKLKTHDALGDATAAAYLLIYSMQRGKKKGHLAFTPNPERPQVEVMNVGSGLSSLKEGDPVRLWVPADQNRGNFYTYDSVAGDGKVGELSSSALEWVIEQQSLGHQFDFTVAKKSWGSCILDIHIKSAAEIAAEQEAAFQKSLADLAKPYRANKPIEFILRVEELDSFKWRKELPLDVHLPSPDSFHPARESEGIRFECNGTLVDSVIDRSATVRMIRAVNSGYSLRAAVSEVQRKAAFGGRQVVASVDFPKTNVVEV
jgi:DNA polymerase III epsilon subunit-like protein